MTKKRLIFPQRGLPFMGKPPGMSTIYYIAPMGVGKPTYLLPCSICQRFLGSVIPYFKKQREKYQVSSYVNKKRAQIGIYRLLFMGELPFDPIKYPYLYQYRWELHKRITLDGVKFIPFSIWERINTNEDNSIS